MLKVDLEVELAVAAATVEDRAAAFAVEAKAIAELAIVRRVTAEAAMLALQPAMRPVRAA